MDIFGGHHSAWYILWDRSLIFQYPVLQTWFFIAHFLIPIKLAHWTLSNSQYCVFPFLYIVASALLFTVIWSSLLLSSQILQFPYFSVMPLPRPRHIPDWSVTILSPPIHWWPCRAEYHIASVSNLSQFAVLILLIPFQCQCLWKEKKTKTEK